MKDAWRMFGWGIALLAIASVGWSASPVSRGSSPEELKAAAQQVLEQRDAALTQWQEQYRSAPLSDRVRLEAEAAQIQTDYERRYLELVVDYHRLSGNTEELARAERMLENLNAGVAIGTPLPLDRNLQAPVQVSDQPQEGVVHDEQ